MKHQGRVEFGASLLNDGFLQPNIKIEMDDGSGRKKWFTFDCDHSFPNDAMAKAFVQGVFEILCDPMTRHSNFFRGERPSEAK